MKKRTGESILLVDEHINAICQMCAERYNVTIEQMKSPWRGRDVVRARRLAWYIMRKLLMFSMARCGSVFNRDHASVLNGLKKLDDFIDINAEPVLKDIEDVREKINTMVSSELCVTLERRYPNTWERFIGWTNRPGYRKEFSDFSFQVMPFDFQAKTFARFINEMSKGVLDISPIYDFRNEVAIDSVRFFFEYFEFRAKDRMKPPKKKRGRPKER